MDIVLSLEELTNQTVESIAHDLGCGIKHPDMWEALSQEEFEQYMDKVANWIYERKGI